MLSVCEPLQTSGSSIMLLFYTGAEELVKADCALQRARGQQISAMSGWPFTQ